MNDVVRRVWQWVWRAARWTVGLVLLALLLRYSTLPTGETWAAVALLAREWQFDYIGWELAALGVKAEQTVTGLHPYISEADRSALVRQYMADLAQAQALEREIDAVYADPETDDAAAASLSLRAERDALRASLRTRQGLVESILEGQVAAVLIDEGFGVGGQLVPPLAMHFTRVPNLLITSPRDAIRFDVALNLDPMTVEEQAALEARIDREQNVSSLITPLGGIALYPSMILETASTATAMDVIAHEWLHHYLFGFPLGYSYDITGETRVINETTAYLFGREVGRLVVARYYPELVALRDACAGMSRRAAGCAVPLQAVFLRRAQWQGERESFDFGAAMHETRVTVDALLAEGRVEAAEAYMERRRALFVENGYLIRKLNQAYFAFYGGYQTGAPGEGGSDPTGAAVLALRERSPSLLAWIEQMRWLTTRTELLAAAGMGAA